MAMKLAQVLKCLFEVKCIKLHNFESSILKKKKKVLYSEHGSLDEIYKTSDKSSAVKACISYNFYKAAHSA